MASGPARSHSALLPTHEKTPMLVASSQPLPAPSRMRGRNAWRRTTGGGLLPFHEAATGWPHSRTAALACVDDGEALITASHGTRRDLLDGRILLLSRLMLDNFFRPSDLRVPFSPRFLSPDEKTSFGKLHWPVHH